jgi:hypothetical protein
MEKIMLLLFEMWVFYNFLKADLHCVKNTEKYIGIYAFLFEPRKPLEGMKTRGVICLYMLIVNEN